MGSHAPDCECCSCRADRERRNRGVPARVEHQGHSFGPGGSTQFTYVITSNGGVHRTAPDMESPGWALQHPSTAQRMLGDDDLRVVLRGAGPAEIKEAFADLCRVCGWGAP